MKVPDFILKRIQHIAKNGFEGDFMISEFKESIERKEKQIFVLQKEIEDLKFRINENEQAQKECLDFLNSIGEPID